MDFTSHPWEDLDVNKIPIKIVDDLYKTGDSEITITLQEKSEEPTFLPLNEEDDRIVGLKFGLTLNKTDHNLKFVTKQAKGVSFNALSSFNFFTRHWWFVC